MSGNPFRRHASRLAGEALLNHEEAEKHRMSLQWHRRVGCQDETMANTSHP